MNGRILLVIGYHIQNRQSMDFATAWVQTLPKVRFI